MIIPIEAFFKFSYRRAVQSLIQKLSKSKSNTNYGSIVC